MTKQDNLQAEEDMAQFEQEADELTTALVEIENLKDKHLRAVAELQNIQRRAQRDVEDANKYAVGSAAKAFLGVADNLARALQLAPADANDAFIEGIRATQRELQNALERMGIVAIAPDAGQPLNPHEHEVMFEVPTTEQENGTIIQVLETGYKIYDRLLRPARVSVAKNGNTQVNMDVSA